MKCAVIMPVGPGHEALALDAQDSVRSAFAHARGAFTALEMIVVDDTAATLGRSQARNNGVAAAAAAGADWIFFLDADDIMDANAFAAVAPSLAGHDAVWGAIAELAPDEESGVLREEQLPEIHGIEPLLSCDPYGLLQIGHFVKTAVALAHPFDTALDAGEDFDYYLRVWAKHKCIKIPQPLFYNRRGMHSTGPRSATGRQWRETVQKLVCKACIAHEFHADFTHRGVPLRFYIWNPYDSVQRTLLKSRFFETAELECVEQWVGSGARIVEVGAYVGNHAVYYLRFMQPAALTVFEPNPAIVPLLERNLAANPCAGLTPEVHALAAGNSEARFDAVSDDAENQGATRLVAAADGAIRSTALDATVRGAVDFIKIDAEGMELEVLAGAARIVRESRPKIMIEVFNAHAGAFASWLAANRYRIYREFKYVNAATILIEQAP
jgi:FkbM family methyltransferase